MPEQTMYQQQQQPVVDESNIEIVDVTEPPHEEENYSQGSGQISPDEVDIVDVEQPHSSTTGEMDAYNMNIRQMQEMNLGGPQAGMNMGMTYTEMQMQQQQAEMMALSGMAQPPMPPPMGMGMFPAPGYGMEPPPHPGAFGAMGYGM